MALTQLTREITAKTFPFTQPVSFNASRYSTVPWGQALINETFETPAIGGGDTGLVIVEVALPPDYVAMLRNFHLQIVDTGSINWKDAAVGFAYQQPGGPYKTSIAEYPEDEYSWYQLVRDVTSIPDRFATNIKYAMYNFGYEGEDYAAHNDAWDPTQLPLWVPPSVDSSFLQRTMIMFIENANDIQPVQQMTFRASFDLFTFDQAYSAAVMSSPRVFS